jgi:hypothetical protein
VPLDKEENSKFVSINNMIHERKYPGKQAQVASSMTLIYFRINFNSRLMSTKSYTFPTLKGGGGGVNSCLL